MTTLFCNILRYFWQIKNGIMLYFLTSSTDLEFHFFISWSGGGDLLSSIDQSIDPYTGNPSFWQLKL